MTTGDSEAFELLAEQVLLQTVDPTVLVDGRPVPALTSLLYRVCANDPDKFAEATRLVELFVRVALRAAGGSIS